MRYCRLRYPRPPGSLLICKHIIYPSQEIIKELERENLTLKEKNSSFVEELSSLNSSLTQSSMEHSKELIKLEDSIRSEHEKLLLKEEELRAEIQSRWQAEERAKRTEEELNRTKDEIQRKDALITRNQEEANNKEHEAHRRIEELEFLLKQKELEYKTSIETLEKQVSSGQEEFDNVLCKLNEYKSQAIRLSNVSLTMEPNELQSLQHRFSKMSQDVENLNPSRRASTLTNSIAFLDFGQDLNNDLLSDSRSQNELSFIAEEKIQQLESLLSSKQSELEKTRCELERYKHSNSPEISQREIELSQKLDHLTQNMIKAKMRDAEMINELNSELENTRLELKKVISSSNI